LPTFYLDIFRSVKSELIVMPSGLEDALEHSGGHGKTAQGVSISVFLASLATAIIVFVIEFLLFLLLKGKLTRI
jgi:hypothetical protein